MHLEGALLGWRQHSQAQQEELGEHQRSPSFYPQGVVREHRSKKGGDRIGVQGSAHGNSLCCSSSVAPINGFQATGSIWRYLGTQREGQRGLLDVLCLCPPGKCVLVPGEVLGSDLINPCMAPRIQPQLWVETTEHCIGQSPSPCAEAIQVCGTYPHGATYELLRYGLTHVQESHWCSAKGFTFLFGTQHKVLASCTLFYLKVRVWSCPWKMQDSSSAAGTASFPFMSHQVPWKALAALAASLTTAQRGQLLCSWYVTHSAPHNESTASGHCMGDLVGFTPKTWIPVHLLHLS